MSGRVLSVASAPAGWWALWRLHPETRPESGDNRRRRMPVATWALVDAEPKTNLDRRTDIVGLLAVGSHLGPPPEGAWYAHEAHLPPCRCDSPVVEQLDPVWCEACAGVLAKPVEVWD